MIGGFMGRLLKKDPDAVLLEDQEGRLYVETTQDIDKVAPEMAYHETPPVIPTDERLLEEATVSPIMYIEVQLVYWAFVVAAIVYLMCGLLGSVPYWVLDLDETHTAVIVTLCVSAGLFYVLYIAMAVARKKPTLAIYLLVAWAFVAMVFVGSVAAALRILAPLQLMAVGWCQSLSVVIYAHSSPQHISPMWAAVWMFLATVVVWGIGIYAFVVESDWAASGVILGLGMALVGYNTFEIRAMLGRTDYTVSYADKVEVAVRYFVDPILGLAWLLKRCWTRV